MGSRRKMKQSHQIGITLFFYFCVILYHMYSSSSHIAPEGNELGYCQDANCRALHTLPTMPQSLPTHMRRESKGAVLALSFYDQTTSALRKVVSLACWAGGMDMAVVEPFVNQTLLSGPVHLNISNNIRFRDVIDIHVWNRKLVESNFSPLISWEQFVRNASRNVVLVEFVYNEKGYPSECRFEDLHKFWKNWLAPYHFRIHAKMCLDFREYKLLSSMKTFNSMVFPTQNSSLDNNVTVIFSEWRGIIAKVSRLKRIPVKTKKCNLFNVNCLKLVKSAFTPTSNLLAQVDLYVRKYLKSDFSYGAVMVRWQKNVGRTNDLNFMKCVDSIKKRMHSFDVIFMAFDVGKYGTSDLVLPAGLEYSALLEATERLLKFAYGHAISLSTYDDRFTNITAIDNPLYMSIMQKYIAAKAKCLLLFGGGYFQEHAAHIWRKYHPNQFCLTTMKYC